MASKAGSGHRCHFKAVRMVTCTSNLLVACTSTPAFCSGGEDVDILPSRASKGKALSFLLKQVPASVLATSG